MNALRLGDRMIGPDTPCFVIAEGGANHNSDPKLALRLVEEAARAGADAIKFQTYSAERLVTRTAPKYYVDTMEQWRRRDPPTGYQLDEFRELDQLPPSTYRELAGRSADLGITFLSTPFDEAAVDLLDELPVAAFKIASADITALPFLRYVASKGRPILLSTGCSTIAEVEEAVDAIAAAGNEQVALLHCTLSYPCDYPDANLNMMKTLQAAFPHLPVGLSDHTLGTLVPAIAAAHGARLVEKHFTLDKSLPTSTDHFMSVDPCELAAMVRDIRTAEAAMGQSVKRVVAAESAALQFARRSVVAVVDLPEGVTIQHDQVALKRPGTGIAPKFLEHVVGRRVARAIAADTVLTWEMLR